MIQIGIQKIRYGSLRVNRVSIIGCSKPVNSASPPPSTSMPTTATSPIGQYRRV